MSAKEPSEPDVPTKPAGGKKKLILLAVPVVLVLAGAGLWFTGILPSMLGMGKEARAAEKKDPEAIGKEAAAPQSVAEHAPVFLDMPEIVANLNGGPRRNSFIKLHAKLELARAEDQPAATAAMPRLLDLFQTYLREMRPEELRGAEGTYRLREELIARADIAVSPAHVVNVLFTDMIIQ